MTQLPFLEPFLTEKIGTLYFLSDPHTRMRDPLAALQLARFFSGHGVNVKLRGVLARRPNLLNDDDLVRVFHEAEKGSKKAEALLQDTSKSLEDRIRGLFRIANKEEADRRRGEQDVTEPLTPRGPVCILGRPQMYPKSFQEAISRELESCCARGIEGGRFKLLSDDPNKPKEFRTFMDTNSGVVIPYVPYGRDSGKRSTDTHVDYAVVRMASGSYRNRVFVFVYGTGSLGTLAAAQTIIDPDQNELFKAMDIWGFFREHQDVEVFLRAERRASLAVPWTRDFEPTEIRVIAPPVETASEKITDCIDWFTRATRPGFTYDGLYKIDSIDGESGLRRYEIVGYHPHKHTGSSVRLWQMVGGREVRRLTDALVEHARADTHNAVLLAGPTGVGKELAARILYEERTYQLLKQLSSDSVTTRPVTVGAKYAAINAAALVETLAEAQLFGIRDGMVDNLGSQGALLDAGEGVVLLDELEAMKLDRQAKILRVVQPPYTVSPIGTVEPVPCTAAIIVATNEDPETLVSEGRLRPDLYARLRPRTVRIPPLKERPSDIPALVAFLAEEPVRFDDRVLRCLLADPHHYNIRGLYQVIGRARRRQNRDTGDSGKGVLEIDFSDLSADVQGAFRDIIQEAASQQKAKDKRMMFEFHAKPPLTIAQALYEEAVMILSSIVIKGDGQLVVRNPDKDYVRIWSRSVQYQGVDAEKLGERWFNLVGHAIRACEQDPSTDLDKVLTVFGDLFKTLCPRPRSQNMGLRMWAYNAFKKRKTRGGMSQKDFAASVGMPNSRFSELGRAM